jgi:hypothetical protein
MAAPIVYRWDDGNAPVARGERRSLCDILYACLVTGYGTKPGAGWTREFVNATFDKAAFRNNPATGTGFYLQVNGATAAYAYRSSVQGFESMTSESDGLFPFYATVSGVDTSNAANTTAHPWLLIADDRFFYFICWSALTTTPTISNNAVSAMAFGDMVEYREDDAFACLLIASYYGISPYTAAASTTVSASDIRVPRKYSGALGSSHCPVAVHNGGPCIAGASGGSGLTYVSGQPFFYARPWINNGEAYTVRGWLPGYYYVCHPNPFTSQFQALTLDGKNFMGLRTYSAVGNDSSYLISLDDWRA